LKIHLNSILFCASAGAILGIAAIGTMLASFQSSPDLAHPAPYDAVTNYGFPLTPVPDFIDEPGYVPTWTPVPPTPIPATPVPTYVQNTPAYSGVSASSHSGDGTCANHPDRYNWQPYALAAGFPEWAMSELAVIISHESGGDLCAVNSSSGASCWIQQLPGGPQFFDPVRCMSQGYSKWVDGGQSFYRHWYQWWGR
jgi:hypothetical protein